LTERDLHFDAPAAAEPAPANQSKTLEEMERHYIEQVLLQEGWRVESAAKRLGIPRSSMYHKLKQYQISRPGYPMVH
jgi:DNA-binding NtrC family response regulator